jgi:GDPmannose 4,6-dehydratase
MRAKRKALITGITGQDGSYLAELLLQKGYEVHGIIRRASTFNTARIDHIFVDPHEEDVRLLLHYGDLSDMGQISNIIYNIKPDEIYNLGAQSHVGVSYQIPEYTGNITALGATRMLEAAHRCGKSIKFYQASSSEMFGDTSPPQNLDSPFRPRSPYAAAKLYAHWMTRIHREGYSLYACNGILFNHESPRRGETFVTRKISMAVANILGGNQKFLYLGNLESRRDWGYAPEYVEAMWKILQQEKPDDYVIGTGRNHSVKEYLELAFSYVGKDYTEYVRIDPRYFRPLDPEALVCDLVETTKKLNWKPKITFEELVKIMVDADMQKIGLDPPGEGDEILSKKYPNRWWGVP